MEVEKFNRLHGASQVLDDEDDDTEITEGDE
jgi:hypothetical protein